MMQTVMKKYVRLPLRYVLLCGLVLGMLLSLYLYFGITDAKWSGLVGGISGGIAVYIIGFLFSMYEYKEIDRFRALGVVDLLADRRDDKYYKTIVQNAKEVVQVMGTSCTRFIDDFANPDNKEHALVDALNRRSVLRVQFLIPTQEHMDAASKHRFEANRNMIERVVAGYERRIELRRYNFQARHSMVRVDNNLIVGPVFQDVESRDTPAIHVQTTSLYAEKYIAYFTWVWQRSDPLK